MPAKITNMICDTDLERVVGWLTAHPSSKVSESSKAGSLGSRTIKDGQWHRRRHFVDGVSVQAWSYPIRKKHLTGCARPNQPMARPAQAVDEDQLQCGYRTAMVDAEPRYLILAQELRPVWPK
ncbi:hypothetical protein [Aquabacterium sp. CECT 9606]|uniref:hypothetical protein n=1 Tax=Aquabacterium sp. CECT 9606 TaxID=2845822 RepID=UPI001E4748B2|nr:hypothetical protein [Aquabacterium sp. CECT 9606]